MAWAGEPSSPKTFIIYPKKPFQRLVHEISLEHTSNNPVSFQRSAILALQEATEAFVVASFESK
jgi:histone H3/H4